jgi:hydrogenase/urease accessory protein HupE
MQIKTLSILIFGLLPFGSSPLLAHTGDPEAGLWGLLIHPLTGMDHLLVSVLIAAAIVGMFHWRQTRKR